MPNDIVRVKIWASVGLHNCKEEKIIEFDREEWEEMEDDDERFEALKDEIDQLTNSGWYVMEED